MTRQQGRVILNCAVPGDGDKILGRKQQHVGHDPKVDVKVSKGLVCLGLAVGRKLEQAQSLLLRSHLERVRPRALLVRRDKNACNLVPPCQKCFQHALAKILLANDGDFHSFTR